MGKSTHSRILKHPGFLLGGIVFAAWLASLTAVVIWGAFDGAVPSGAIVVMGAAQYSGRPSPVLKARLDHAVDLWKQGLAPLMVLTGGRGEGDTTTEAAVGRHYVMREGVPDSLILLENQGRTTRASLSAVAAMMTQDHIGTAILVSDPFHMLRLQILARHLGLKTVTSPTRTSPISARWSQVVGYVLSESVKVPATLLFGIVWRDG
jgi:uncharacterized SAM-binding protein YcdF (DUF218 family)